MDICLNEYYISELAKQCANMDIIPFIGAGLSYPTYPLWRDYIISIAKDFFMDLERINIMLLDNKFEEASDYIYDNIGERAFMDHIKKTFSIEKIKTKEQNPALIYMPLLFPNTVITSNYDGILEYVYEKENQKFEECLFPSQYNFISETISDHKRYLIKIHGDIEGRADIVLCKKQYDNLYGEGTNLGKPFTKLLGRIMLSKKLLFLGCSINNDRTIETLKLVSKILGESTHYAIVEKPNDNNSFIKRLKFLSDLGIRAIWYPNSKHEYVSIILKYLYELSKRDIAQNMETRKLISKISLSDVELLRNVATVKFDDEQNTYELKIQKQFKLLALNNEWYDGHIYANKFLENAEESINFYKMNQLKWENLNTYAKLRVKKNTQLDFNEMCQVMMSPMVENNNFIQFRIFYRTLDGKRIILRKGDIIELEYGYTISNQQWGSYLNRQISYFEEYSEIKLVGKKEIKYDLFTYFDSSEKMTHIDNKNYTYYKEHNDENFIETIVLPKSRCSKFVLFWDANSYFSKIVT